MRTKLHFDGDPPDSIRKLVRREVKRLRLEHWTITIAWLSTDDFPQGSEEDSRGMVTMAEIIPANEYRKAVCSLPDTTRADEAGADTVRHELLHCVLAAISHSVTQWFEMEREAYPKAFSIEAFNRLMRLMGDAEDSVIEHLLDVIG